MKETAIRNKRKQVIAIIFLTTIKFTRN